MEERRLFKQAAEHFNDAFVPPPELDSYAIRTNTNLSGGYYGYALPSSYHPWSYNTGMYQTSSFYGYSYPNCDMYDSQPNSADDASRASQTALPTAVETQDIAFASKAKVDVTLEGKCMKSSNAPFKDEKVTANHEEAKPPYSLIALVAMAINNEPSKTATLKEIIAYIEQRFSYYRNKKKTWQRSLRHCLTLNDCFVKKQRRSGEKGHPWAIDPEFADMFDNGSLLRRRYRFKQGSANWQRSQQRALKSRDKTSARLTADQLEQRLPTLTPTEQSWTMAVPQCSERGGATDSNNIFNTSYLTEVDADSGHITNLSACEQRQDYFPCHSYN